MPVYQLGNGNDDFNSQNQVDWTNDSAVFGGNGNDTIIARALSPTYTSHLFVDGGNGNDSILLDAGNSIASGGNGNDTLTSEGGLGNTLIGGNGRDTLISLGGGSGMGPGNTLTGGLGRDTFILVNDGNLVVTNQQFGGGLISDGDTFIGPMDVITDYQRGEHIGLRQYDINANGPAAEDVPLARINGSVTVVNDPLPHTGETYRPAIDSAEYAVFHGTFAGGNTFTVNANGPDLFAVYDTRTGPFELVGKGSLVLQGVTDERLLAEALSPSTAQKPGGGWSYSFDQSGGSQAAAMSAILDPADSTGAMGVIPA